MTPGILLAVFLGVTGLGTSAPLASAVALGITCGAFAIWALLRVSVTVDDDALIVRNVWRTYVAPWRQVTAISIVGWWPSLVCLYGALACLKVETTDARRIYVQASVNTGPDEKIVAALRKESERHPWVRLGFR